MSAIDKSNWEMFTATRIFIGNPDYDVVEITADLVGVRIGAIQVKELGTSVVIVIGNGDDDDTHYSEEIVIPNRIENVGVVIEYFDGVLRVCAQAEDGTWLLDEPNVSSLSIDVDWPDSDSE